MKTIIPISLLFVLFCHGVFMFMTPKDVELDYIFPEDKKVEKIDLFTDITFFITKEGEKYLKFITSELKLTDQKKAEMKKPQALIIHEGKDIYLDANEATFTDGDEKLLIAKGDVNLSSLNFYLSCEKGKYQFDKKLFTGQGNVLTQGVNAITEDKITVKSDRVEAYPLKRNAKLQNITSGIIERKRVYEGKVLFRAKALDLNFNESRITLDEDVFVKRNNVSSSAQKATIFLENFNKKLKYYEMNGGVVITQRLRDVKTGKKNYRKAFAERLEGSVREKKLTLTGSPRVRTKNDIIRGSKIILRENASILEVLNSTAQINIKGK